MSRIASVLLASLLVAGAAPPLHAAPSARADPWIVQLKTGAEAANVAADAGRRLGFRPTHVYQRVMRGFAARLTPAQRAHLLADPRVADVQPDLPTQVAADPQPAPPGVRRVGADPSAIRAVDGSDPALDVDIAILDTGVQYGHPDLRVVGGHNCTTTSTGWKVDGYGHGTHVAGIAAGRDNGIAVVGVAPGARIWSVKVLNSRGNGLLSWLICGLDWVAAKREAADPSRPLIEVTNLSLRMSGADDGNCGLTNRDLLHQAVCRLNRAGVTIVAAAGNDSTTASRWVPAAYDEVITVSAMAEYDGVPGGAGTKPTDCPRPDTDDSFALSFSNDGPDVDLIAPGVCVLSAFPTNMGDGSGYTLMTGTSMATPHVAGGAALYHLYELNEGRSRPTPEQTRAVLRATGRHDWRTGTDPDGKPEPLLDVSTLQVAPGFEVGATPDSQARSPGDTAVFDIWLARLGGFDGAVAFDVSGTPDGSTWSLGGDPFGNGESGWRRLSISLPASGSSSTSNVVITASGGGLSRSVKVVLQFEGGIVGAPGAPQIGLRGNVVSPAVAVPVRISWSPISGADRYQLHVSRDGGLWTTVSLPSARATSFKTSVWPSSTYRYRVRAKVNGTWRSWLIGEPTTAIPQFATDPVTLTGSWVTYSNANTYSEVAAYSTSRGARATLEFVGQSVSWITTRGPSRGVAAIYVDGVLAQKVDLYSSKLNYRYVAFARTWSGSRPHTITIEIRGTSGRPRVDLDALVVVSVD